MTTTTPYPLPSPERRQIVQHLSAIARTLDDEAEARKFSAGLHNAVVLREIARSAGQVRFIATLVVQGGMSIRRAKFWLVAASDYLNLVQRSDQRGVIR